MPQYIVWKPYYSVADDQLDTDHKIIFGLINELYGAINAKREDVDLKAISDRLVRYTATHFLHEETVMKNCDYPGIIEHKGEHDRLRRTTLEYHNNLNLLTGRDMLRFLKDWWTGHIQASDKQYVPYIETAKAGR